MPVPTFNNNACPFGQTTFMNDMFDIFDGRCFASGGVAVASDGARGISETPRGNTDLSPRGAVASDTARGTVCARALSSFERLGVVGFGDGRTGNGDPPGDLTLGSTGGIAAAGRIPCDESSADGRRDDEED